MVDTMAPYVPRPPVVTATPLRPDSQITAKLVSPCLSSP
jgi:hypothetical protein